MPWHASQRTPSRCQVPRRRSAGRGGGRGGRRERRGTEARGSDGRRGRQDTVPMARMPQRERVPAGGQRPCGALRLGWSARVGKAVRRVRCTGQSQRVVPTFQRLFSARENFPGHEPDGGRPLSCFCLAPTCSPPRRFPVAPSTPFHFNTRHQEKGRNQFEKTRRCYHYRTDTIQRKYTRSHEQRRRMGARLFCPDNCMLMRSRGQDTRKNKTQPHMKAAYAYSS